MLDMQTDCFPNTVAEWPKVPVSKLAKVNPRYTAVRGRNYPFVEMASVGEDFAGILRVDRRKLEGSGLARFKAGDTLFAKITPCPENGKVAFVSELPDTLGLGSTEFIVLSPRSETESRFLYHLVCSHSVRGRAVARMEGSTGRQRVPEEVFVDRLLVPMPPPTEQAAIARILDAVDTALERARKTIQSVDVLQGTILEGAFASLEAKHCRLGRFATEVRYGTSVASNDKAHGNPVLRIPNVVGDRLALNDLVFVELSDPDVERLTLADGDLLLVRTNGNPNYVGRSVVFRHPDNRTWVYASYLIRVRLTDKLLPQFVNTYLGLERGRRQLLQRVTTSAGNHNINANSIRLIRLPVPPPAEQERLVELATAFRNRRDALIAMVDALRSLKNSLMHDLLTGKVRVDDVLEAPVP